MKKILAVLSTAFLTAAVFANDIFAGKSFNGGDSSVYYKFNNDNTVNLMFEENVGAVLNYKIDEKKNTIGLYPKKIESTSLGIIGFENKVCEKQEILDFIQAKDFENKTINKMFEEECGFDPKIELGKNDEVEQILNCIAFMNYKSETKTEEAYDKSVDYSEKLREEIKKNNDPEQIKELEESLANIKTELESTTIPQVKSMAKKIEAKLNTIFDTAIIFTYKENEDGSLLLTEETKNVTPNVVFLSMNSANEEKHVYINSSILATADVGENEKVNKIKFYTTKDKCKKDSGNVTFINTDNKKDKVKATYSIKRNEKDIEITLKFTSGNLKDTELKSTYQASTENLTLR